jgi:hypothetical protein
VESGERREHQDNRRSVRTSGKELDAWSHKVTPLYLVVKAVPFQTLYVESSLQSAQQADCKIVQISEALWIRDA